MTKSHMSPVDSRVHEYILGFDILPNAEGASFTPQSAFLDTSKGCHTSAHDSFVHTHQSSLESGKLLENQSLRPTDDSISYLSAQYQARLRSRVQKYAARPVFESLAISSASSSVAKDRTAATGPNVSVDHMELVVDTSERIVGA